MFVNDVDPIEKNFRNFSYNTYADGRLIYQIIKARHH